MWSQLPTIVRRTVHLLARPARADRGRGGLLVQPFRGYGTPSTLFVMGRVFVQPRSRPARSAVRRDLGDVARRVLRRGVPGVAVVVRFGPASVLTNSDQAGYFRCRLPLRQTPPAEHLWHRVSVAVAGRADSRTDAEVFVPPRQARRVIISDIDDTVMYTGVANKVAMLWRLFVLGPKSRTAFPGVAALYRALHRGSNGNELNPMLYVSRGPWGLYELLDEFFRLHRIPVGPILFLRDWGITPARPVPRRGQGHKLQLIRDMLDLYHDLPFVLIGDSGQRDPEIYSQIIQERPGRVAAVYIRNVSRDPRRRQAIERLSVQVAAAGSHLLLAADSHAMARHAADLGLIKDDAVAQVLAERRQEREASPLHPTRHVLATPDRAGPGTTEAVDAALEENTERPEPPNVAIDPEQSPKRPP